VRCHGALVELRGVGVLLLGPSGVGKSECALELVSRGHRLVADDVVVLAQEDAAVVGRPTRILGHHMEIRGLGIVSVPDLFGPESVRDAVRVDLVCRLDPEAGEYDRTGLEREHETLEGVEVPRVVLPPRVGASLATIVDVAARDLALRARGVDAAARFDARQRAATRAGSA